MQPEKLYLKIFASILLMTLVAAFVIHRANHSRAATEIYGEAPEFNFTDQDGLPSGRNDLTGKISVVDFIFTSCPGICPVMSAKMSMLYKLFEKAPMVQFVSISVDPATDTQPVMKKYLDSHGVTDRRWVFLRAPIEEVIQLSEKGFMLAADNLPTMHSAKFVLVDHNGGIRGYYESKNDESIKTLIEHIRQLGKRLL